MIGSIAQHVYVLPTTDTPVVVHETPKPPVQPGDGKIIA
jgi:hypothetical protein